MMWGDALMDSLNRTMGTLSLALEVGRFSYIFEHSLSVILML